MAWTATINPVWAADFPFLEIQYEITGTDPGDPLVLLSDDSTGPVTPGALNPENPFASGARVAIGSAAPGEHHRVFDLRKRFTSDRIARITLLLSGKKDRARLAVRRLVFRTGDPRKPPTDGSDRSTLLLSPDPQPTTSPTADWHALELSPEHAISAAWLARAFGASMDWPADRRLRQAGILFELGPANCAARATGVMETQPLCVAGRWQGSELALLLAARVFGSDRPWYGGRSSKPRPPTTSPHRLVVHLEYDDGTRASHFPWSAGRKSFLVARRPEPYVVPLDAEKTLTRICIVDRMSFGQVFLLGASINRSSTRAFPCLSSDDQQLSPKQQACPRPVPTRFARNEKVLTIENGWFRLVADLESGLCVRSLMLVPFDRRIVFAETGAPLLELFDEAGQPVRLSFEEVAARRMKSSTMLELSTVVKDSAGQRSVTIDLEVEDGGRIRLTPTLTNRAESSWRLGLTYPQLRGCRIAPCGDDACYLLGTRNTTLSHKPVTADHGYGGGFPLPLMDLFARDAGGGIGLMVPDTRLTPKQFRFRKHATAQADMSVHYPLVEVPPQGSQKLPAAILLAHVGDWHDAFAEYRRWARTQFAPSSAKRLPNLFFCRRDYPLGGTDYLFSAQSKRYTPARLIEESRRGFGRIDMIDISGWAYNEKTGRVGDYRTNDIGGIPALARAVEHAHQGGVKLGLYFEGYLLDRRCALAKTAQPAWQLIDRNGKPRWWSGKMECFLCPGVKPWRDALASMIADVADQTRADAVYIDQFGFSGADKACYSADHGHPVPSNPLVEEHKMLEAVRAALDKRTPGTGIYTEQMPCDALSPLVDGAFNYGMTAARATHHVTKLPLHRYVFPETAVIEMIGHGIRPIPVTPENLHLCFFHGLAVWLKGRADSWYSADFLALARRIAGVYEAHGAVFRSADCVPLIHTLRTGLYANRFSTPKKRIITLYNARPHTITGPLIRIRLPRGGCVRNLLADDPAHTTSEGDWTVIHGQLAPHCADAFLIGAAP